MRCCQKINAQKRSNALLYFHSRSSLSAQLQSQSQSQSKYERYFVITDERHIDIWREHSSMVLPHISKKTDSNILKLRNRENVGVLIRSDCNEKIQNCTNQIFNLLNQTIIELRPASLQPLFGPITKMIRTQHTDLDIFIDSYSSQIYVRGNEESKKNAVKMLNKLMSINHLKQFELLFLCRNILPKHLIFDLAQKCDVYIADNFANEHGSKCIQYFMTSLRQSNMHSFLTQMAKIAQKAQPEKIRKILFVLRHIFKDHGVNSSQYIDLKTFVCILRNFPIFNSANYDILSADNEKLIKIFEKCQFSHNDRINFIQLALTLCVNDADKQYETIWSVLNECYKNEKILSILEGDNERKKEQKQKKEEKSVTVSLRIGNDGNSLPLFIGKNGKNLKFIEQSSQIKSVHTSWLIKKDDHKNESAEGLHDSITMKGTQQQIEDALRASTVILERIGKWYDKKKLFSVQNALNLEHDLSTFDFETFENAVLSIPNVEIDKLHKNKLIESVFNYCSNNKQKKVYLLNLNANFYCNVSPMIEFRECIPFIADFETETMQITKNQIANNQNEQKIDINLSNDDEQSLSALNGQIIEEWLDNETNKVRKKEIVQIADKTAMSMTDSTLNTLSHYSCAKLSVTANNKIEIIGNEKERFFAKSLLTEPLMKHWNAQNGENCVNWLVGKSGRRIKKIEEESGCRVEVVNLDEMSSQIIIRGLPSQQTEAMKLCLETQKLCKTQIPQSTVNGIIRKNGAGLSKLAQICGADIFIEKAEKKDQETKDVNVEIVGIEKEKQMALSLLKKWGNKTLKMRQSENFKLRITDIPTEHATNDEVTEKYIRELLRPFGCNVQQIKVIDYRQSIKYKKRSLAYFAYVCVDSFVAKMSAICTLNNCHDTNLKIWNGEPIGTMIAPSVPFSISEEEFKQNCFSNYQDVKNIFIDDRTKIDRYTAYIEFDDKRSFLRACEFNLQIRGQPITTFAAKQHIKELKSYREDENAYKKEFAFYLQYCLDNYCDGDDLNLQNLPKIYERICNVPWLKEFESFILKLHAMKQLDERIELTKEEREVAEKKYFYLVQDGDDDE